MSNTAKKLITFEEYLNYQQDSDANYELIDGELAEIPLPTVRHILIAKMLEKTLDAEIQRQHLPWICLRELGVRTALYKSRIADLGIVTQAQAQELMEKSAVFQSLPVLIIEIVSPESVTRDYRYKRSEYASLGIPEYWIVDSLEEKVSVLRLEEGFYEMTAFSPHQAIHSIVFPELSLSVADILMTDTTRTL
jgi:Uma2 family endonuclease